MMMSVDGRIDCAMTELLGDNEAYYNSLSSLKCSSSLIGRATMMSCYTDGLRFVSSSQSCIGQAMNVARLSDGYTVVVDTHGTLNISSAECGGLPLIVVMSEDAPADYAAHLTQLGVNWMAVGKVAIDLPRMAEALSTKFGVERLAVLGGGSINGAMLAAGLVDEVSVIVGAGVDGRSSQRSLFDGLADDGWSLVRLRLQGVARVGAEAVWLRYDVCQ